MRAQAAPASGRDGRGILARLRTPTAPRESMTYTGTSMAHPHDISLRPRHGVAHIPGDWQHAKGSSATLLPLAVAEELSPYKIAKIAT